MDKTKLICAIPLCVALVLTGCQEEAVPAKSPVADGPEGILTLTLGGDASMTKAVGDYVPDGVTTQEEKEVRSLALFVKTDASGTEADFKPGAFARFLSESDKPEEQLSEPLTEAGAPGLYTCQVKVHSYSWRNPEVIAIANYKENGLADDLRKLASWDELRELTTSVPAGTTSAALLTCPLLMYGHSDIHGWGTSPDGMPATESVTLTRLAARLDVRNICYDKDNPEGGFVLQRVTLCNSLSRSYVCPPADATFTLGLPVVDRVALEAADIQEANEGGRVFQQAASLYTYETDNSLEKNATYLRLDGTYKGSAISVKAEFKKETADGKTAWVPIGRNHRYVVTLSNQLGDEAPASAIEVKEWASKDEITAGPSAEAPTLGTVTCALAPGETGTAGTYDEATKTLDITHATAPTRLSFKASGNGFVPDYYVTLNHEEGYDWKGATVAGGIQVMPGGFIRPEAFPGQFDREFTVTVPARTARPDTEGTPAYEAWIYIYNSALGETMAEVITVKADAIPASK